MSLPHFSLLRSPAPNNALPHDPTAFIPRYWLNIIVVGLTALSVVGSVIVQMASAEFLGLTAVQWHWIVVFFAVCSALSAAFNPNALSRPTPARMQLEREYHEYRQNIKGKSSRQDKAADLRPLGPDDLPKVS